MQLSVELTFYPLQEGDYRPVIKAFIQWLNDRGGDLKIETFPTCTVVTGEHDLVMDTLRDGLRWSRENQGKGAFVAKFLPGFEAL